MRREEHAGGERDDASRRSRWRRWRRAAGAGTRALLDQLADGDPEDLIRLGDLMTGLGRRAFGVLLFLAIPPSLIPGVAGVISTPIVLLVGLQLMVGMRRPWLPRWLAMRGPHRSVLIKFDRWFSPVLARLEKVVKPRMTVLLDHRLAAIVSGVLLVLLGLLLALPIPLTNGIFGGLLLLFALALLERDGALMAVAWITGAIAVAVFGVLSGNLAAMAARWVDVLI
jgi:hypothetical protein